jgi:hypothetical protein
MPSGVFEPLGGCGRVGLDLFDEAGPYEQVGAPTPVRCIR